VILLADLPSAPTSLQRVEAETLPAGNIQVSWRLPADEGGDPVTGYSVYLDGEKVKSYTSTQNTHSFTGLTVSAFYTVAVTALNDVGESEPVTISLKAASVPSKLQPLGLKECDKASITVYV
jgi:hypothetical protein